MRYLTILALALATGAIAEPRSTTLTGLNLNHNLTDGEAGKAMAYQCARDWDQCLRSMPETAVYSAEAYTIEVSLCCVGLTLCADLAADVNQGGRLPATLQIVYDATSCGEDAASPPMYGNRRTALLDGLRNAPRD